MAEKNPAPASFSVVKTQDEWKAELTPEEFAVIRSKVGTQERGESVSLSTFVSKPPFCPLLSIIMCPSNIHMERDMGYTGEALSLFAYCF